MKRIAVTFAEPIGRRMRVAAAQEGVTLSAYLVSLFTKANATVVDPPAVQRIEVPND